MPQDLIILIPLALIAVAIIVKLCKKKKGCCSGSSGCAGQCGGCGQRQK